LREEVDRLEREIDGLREDAEERREQLERANEHASEQLAQLTDANRRLEEFDEVRGACAVESAVSAQELREEHQRALSRLETLWSALETAEHEVARLETEKVGLEEALATQDERVANLWRALDEVEATATLREERLAEALQSPFLVDTSQADARISALRDDIASLRQGAMALDDESNLFHLDEQPSAIDHSDLQALDLAHQHHLKQVLEQNEESARLVRLRIEDEVTRLRETGAAVHRQLGAKDEEIARLQVALQAAQEDTTRQKEALSWALKEMQDTRAGGGMHDEGDEREEDLEDEESEEGEVVAENNLEWEQEVREGEEDNGEAMTAKLFTVECSGNETDDCGCVFTIRVSPHHTQFVCPSCETGFGLDEEDLLELEAIEATRPASALDTVVAPIEH